MKFLLIAGTSALLITSGLLSAPHSFGQTQTPAISDFATAVQAGLQSLAINSVAHSQQQEIQNQDYKSTWDEFGINTLVDGSMSPAEVNNLIIQDIIQSIETAHNYDQQEASYLQTTQTTPEQVQATETSVGADIPPSQPINPNPSLDANPDVNTSPVDTFIQDTIGTNENGNSTQDANTPVQGPTNSTQDPNSSIPDMNAPTIDTSVSPSESAIYDAILQGEQTQPVDQTDSTPDNNVNSPASPVDNAPSTP